jgi:hypothetical protein
MGTNPFISHRMFVEALKGGDHTHNPRSPASHAEAAGKLPPVKLSAEQLAALAARQWLDFPFAPRIEPRAS